LNRSAAQTAGNGFYILFLNIFFQNIQRNFSLPGNRLPYAESANLISNLTIVHAEALHIDISAADRDRYLDLLQPTTVTVGHVVFLGDEERFENFPASPRANSFLCELRALGIVLDPSALSSVPSNIFSTG